MPSSNSQTPDGVEAATVSTTTTKTLNKTSQYNSKLWDAAFDGNLHEVQDLVRKGADVNYPNDNNGGATPLYIASQNGHLEVVQWLCQQGGAKVDQAKNDGKTPLDIAKERSHNAIVDFLTNWKQLHKSNPDESSAVLAQEESSQTKETIESQEVNPSEIEKQQLQQTVEELKRLQNELDARINRTNNLLVHGHEDLSQLNELTEHLDPLSRLAAEKRVKDDLSHEFACIDRDLPTRDFYLMFMEKVDCLVLACKGLASGMLGKSESSSFRQFLVNDIRGESSQSIKSMFKGTAIAKLVGDAVRWATKQVPLPFLDTIGSLIQTIASIASERDQYLAISRVAAFAALADEVGGCRNVFALLARYAVRTRSYVGTEPVFPGWRKRLLGALGESVNSREKAQGCLLAEKTLACIMNPKKGCPIQALLVENRSQGTTNDTILTRALAKQVLGLDGNQIDSLEFFSVVGVSTFQSLPPPASSPNHKKSPPANDSRSFATASPMSSVGETAMLTRLQEVEARMQELHTDKTQLQEQVRELHTDKTQLQEQVRELHKMTSRGKEQQDQKNENGSMSFDAGNGQKMCFAVQNNEEKYEGRLEKLEGLVGELLARLNLLSDEHTGARETLESQINDVETEIDSIRKHKRRLRVRRK